MVLNRNPAPPAKPTNLYSESCGFVTLYTDDIDAIKRYLETRCETVTLAAGRATADEGIDLLGATEAEWSDVRLETKNPSIQVSLLPQAARVLTYEDREEARELVRATASIVREHRSSLLATASTIEALYLAFAIVVLVLPLAITSYTNDQALWNIVLTGVAVAISAVFATWAGVRQVRLRWARGRSSLRRGTRASVPAGRSGAQVALLASVAGPVAGAAITFAITMLNP